MIFDNQFECQPPLGGAIAASAQAVEAVSRMPFATHSRMVQSWTSHRVNLSPQAVERFPPKQASALVEFHKLQVGPDV